jgi:hypothetical protein
MPEKKREPFVKDAEARELDMLFAMREVRRIARLREQGTVVYAEKWRMGQARKPISKFHKAFSHSCGVISGLCWFCVLGSAGSLERNRIDLRAGTLMMFGFTILALLFGALAFIEPGTPSRRGRANG